MKPSSPKWLKLTNCEALKTEQLTRVWDNFLASERSNESTYSSQVCVHIHTYIPIPGGREEGVLVI